MTYIWTAEEKRDLLLALHKHGSSKLELLQEELPYKSMSEIRYYVEKYSTLGMKKLEESEEYNDDPLKDWIKLIKKSELKNTGPVTDIIPRTLKYISLFETNNSPQLKECYKILTDMCNGSAPKKTSAESLLLFNKCLAHLSRSVEDSSVEKAKDYFKQFNDFDELMEAKKNLNSNLKPLNPLAINDDLLQKTRKDTESIKKFSDSLTN